MKNVVKSLKNIHKNQPTKMRHFDTVDIQNNENIDNFDEGIVFALKSVNNIEENPSYRGCIDFFENGVVSGWAYVHDEPSEEVLLDIFIFGEYVGRVGLENFRSDINEKTSTSKKTGFTFDLKKIEKRLRSRAIKNILNIEKDFNISSFLFIKFSNKNYFLPMSKSLDKYLEIDSLIKLLSVEYIDSDLLNNENKDAEYKIRLETVNDSNIRGWVVNLTDPSDIFDINVMVDSVWFCKLTNNFPREDLKKAKLSNGKGGIQTSIPNKLWQKNHATIGFSLPNGKVIERKVTVQPKLYVPHSPQTHTSKNVSIIVPIYNAINDVKVCIERIISYTPSYARVILIDDSSSDENIRKFLREYQNISQFTVLFNEKNIGFTKTVNRGIQESGNDDVVFLNSDARVTPKWLEGLLSAAASDPLIGTVTPFSDRAGAFSAPRIGNKNRLPFGISEEEYAVSVRRHSLRLYPSVPTGNGFCMYVRRTCINEVGLLDEKAFPRGYGEENDFCMRARDKGWRNVIDDATYVFHERSKSFGEQKTDLMAAGRKMVNSRHPDYNYAIKCFTESLQIALARHRVGVAEKALLSGDTFLPRALFVTATTTGGTPQTNQDLMNALSESWELWLLRCNSKTMTLYYVTQDKSTVVEEHTLEEPVSPTSHRSFEYDRVVIAWLAKYEFDLVHIRQLIWHSLSLPRLAKESGALVINSFHDFYTLSSSVKLLDEDGVFQGSHCPVGKAYIESELWPADSTPKLDSAWTYIWQKKFTEALDPCDAFVTTSPSSRKMILPTLSKGSADRFVIIPHGRDFPKMYQKASWPVPEQAIRILVPGNISIAKGKEIIEGLLDRDTVNCQLEFHILGSHNFLDTRRGLVFHGPYKRHDFFNHVVNIDPHVGAVFSIWDETFCHTLTEMWVAGLPVIGLDYPTVAGRIRAANAGWVYSEKDLDSLYAELIRDMHIVDSYIDRLRAVINWQRGEGKVHTTRFMASRYQALYNTVLRGKSSIACSKVDTIDLQQAVEDTIAVVCPANAKLDRAPGSTHVRVWARTHNNVNRAVSYVRLTPEELLAAVRSGNIDKAILQRNALSARIWNSLKKFVESNDLRYIIDLDDDLFNVPNDKDPDGSYAAYTPILQDIVGRATMVTTSTKKLAEKCQKFNSSIEVLPNFLSGKIWRGTMPDRSVDGLVRGLYMGNLSHDADFAMVQPAFEAVAKNNPKLKLRIIGALNTPLAQVPSWLEIVDIPKDARNYPEFVSWMQNQCKTIDFGIAPLTKSPFNYYKSYIKALDYSALGLPVLASEHPVYESLREAEHIVLVGDSLKSWQSALNYMIANKSQNSSIRLSIRDWVSKNHMLEDTIDNYDMLIMKYLKGCSK